MKGAVTRFNRWIKSEHQADWTDDIADRIDIVMAKGSHTFIDGTTKNNSTIKCNSYGTLGVFLGNSLLFRVWLKGGVLQHNFLTTCKRSPTVYASYVGIAADDISGLTYKAKTATTNRIVENEDPNLPNSGRKDFYYESETDSVFTGPNAIASFDQYLIRPEDADGKTLKFAFRIRGAAQKDYRFKYAFSKWVEQHFDTETITFEATFKADGTSIIPDIAVSFKTDKYNTFSISKEPLVKETED